MKLAEASADYPHFYLQPSDILHRARNSSVLTSHQIQVDGLVGGFVHHATDWKSLAAMMAGGMAYRAGRIGSQFSGLRFQALGSVPSRFLSVGAGFTAEVSAFEITHRTLQSLPLTPALSPKGEGDRNSSLAPLGRGIQGEGERALWKWNGTTGLRQGLLHSFIAFGTLKAGGRFTQGRNPVLQHGVQDMAMVAGHQLVYQAGISPKPEGTLLEQLLRAEATNWQLRAGMGLAQALTGGKAFLLEKSLDWPREVAKPRRRHPALSPLFLPMWLMMGAEGAGGPPARGRAEEKRLFEDLPLDVLKKHVEWGSRSHTEEILKRAETDPEAHLALQEAIRNYRAERERLGLGDDFVRGNPGRRMEKRIPPPPVPGESIQEQKPIPAPSPVQPPLGRDLGESRVSEENFPATPEMNFLLSSGNLRIID